MSDAQALRPRINERQLRVDLAAACRLASRLDWQEAVANHFSVATSADGRYFLMNPLWRHFSRLRASDFLLLDAHTDTAHNALLLDPTAWSCLADPQIKPIDQTSARFYNRVAIDTHYGGIADNAAEGLRLTRALGEHSVLMMGNHGVVTVGDTVAETFDALYHLERACRTLLLAHSTGQPLRLLSDEIAERTALSWEDGGAQAAAHFSQQKAILDAEDGSYAE